MSVRKYTLLTELPTLQRLKPWTDMLKNAPIGAVILDQHGKLLWCNTFIKDCFPCTMVVGSPFCSAQEWADLALNLTSGDPFFYHFYDQGMMVTPYELPASQSNILLWMIPSLPPLENNTPDERLLQQHKLAQTGQRILEVAHELNNPLSGLSMTSQLIQRCCDTLQNHTWISAQDAQFIHPSLAQLQQEISRLSDNLEKLALLREHLLWHDRPDTPKLKPNRLKDVVEKALSNVRSQHRFQHLHFNIDLLPESPWILCDPYKLEQIIFNLIENACNATDGKGRIDIRESLSLHDVHLEIEDNGPGIDPALADTIFLPFVTLKPDTGSGLGLSIVHQIVKQHQGKISVYNKAETGACFRITFPRIPQNSLDGLESTACDRSDEPR